MRVEWLIPCRFAELASDGTLNILGAGIDILWVPQESLPAQLGVFVAARVVGSEPEWAAAEGHAFGLKLLRPDDFEEEELLEIPIGQASEFSPFKLPGYEVVASFPIVAQFEANSHGDHTLQAFLDQQRTGNAVNLSIRPPPVEGDDDDAGDDAAAE